MINNYHRFNNRNVRNEDKNRINWQIRVPNVRVVKGEEQLGIMSTDDARKLAQNDGLDLVEVAPGARPPVCKIMDYGQFKYEQNIKRKEGVRKQRESQVSLKELRLRPGTADHDIEIKANQAKKFLEDGCKVQFNLKFRGQRELAHKDQGFLVVKKILEILDDFCAVDKVPKMEGNQIVFCISPKS